MTPAAPGLRGEKILVTGPTSQVALPLVRHLARDNEVHGLARFRKPDTRGLMESAGARCISVDLADDTLDGVPQDYTLVLHFAVVKSGDFDYDLRANAEGVGRLMAHCRSARAFLHCSSAGVYQNAGGHPARESDPLGDNHRVMMPTYSLSKVAAESVVRFAAREFKLPTTIARLSVPYGDNGGWPWIHLMIMKAGQPIQVHPDRPNLFNPIHEDDYIAQVPRLLEIADVPATTLNWGGSEAVSVEDWCGYLGEITGLEPQWVDSAATIASLPVDVGRMHELVGKTRVDWRDGMQRMVKARNPELLPNEA